MNEKMRKAFFTCLTLVCILLFLIYTFEGFEKERVTKIEDMIGAEVGGITSLSVRENMIMRNAIEIYMDSLASGDFDKAYAYLSVPYRTIVSQEDYTKKMTEIGLENFAVIKSFAVQQVAGKLYSIDVTLANDLEQTLLMILDDEEYYIVPEPFIEYVVVDNSITKKGIEYKLNGYQVDLERCIFDFTITNNSNDDLEITDAQMGFSTGGYRQAKNREVTIPANSVKNVSFEVKAYLDFPTNFKIERKDGKNLRIYTFEF